VVAIVKFIIKFVKKIMAINYTWNIHQLETKVRQNDLDNVIFRIHWELVGIDSENSDFWSNRIGAEDVIYNEGEPFTPFNELTKEQVEGWLESILDVEVLKNNIAANIEVKRNPVDEALSPPWNNQSNE
jgi:hypothetical protein